MTEGKGITMPKAVALEVMCKACPNIRIVLFEARFSIFILTKIYTQCSCKIEQYKSLEPSLS